MRAMPTWIYLAGLIALIACVGTGPTGVNAGKETAPRLECDIRSEPKGDFLQLTAIVRSKEPLSGEYNLIVRKHSETGTSENAQSGAFELTLEHERVLTSTLLDHSAFGHYRAELAIKTTIGRVSCSSP
jgi:CsgH protein